MFRNFRVNFTQIQNLPSYGTFQKAVYAPLLSNDVPPIFCGKSENSGRRFSEKVKYIILGFVLAYIVPILGRSNQLSSIEFIERIKKS